MMKTYTVTLTFTAHEADFIAKQLAFLANPEKFTQGTFASRQLATKIQKAINLTNSSR